MSTTVYAVQPLLANRMVRQIGALIDYAQPGDAAFGVTLFASDARSLATDISLVDESPWLVTAGGIILPADTCAIGVNGVAVASAVNAIGEALSRGAAGQIFELIPRTQQSASGFQPTTLFSIETFDRPLVSGDDAHTLVGVGARVYTVPAGLGSGFGVAAKGACAFIAGAGAIVNDVRTPGSLNPWCALIQIGVDTYDVVGGVT
jgi:hypothetical protein